jgi:AcrR family transcriptional regulator
MKPQDPKPRFKAKTVRLAEIHAAARELFFAKGFAGTTMEQIAKSAGVSKGTVYLYFKNKEELYVSLMMPVLEELGRHLEAFSQKVAARQIPDKRAFLDAICEIDFQTYAFDPDGMRIIQAFQLGNHFSAMSPETIATVNLRAANNYRTTRGLLSQAMRDGILKTRDTVQLTDILWSLFIGVVQLEESKTRTTRKDHLKGTLRAAFEILADGL